MHASRPDTIGEGRLIVPRPVVVMIVLGCLAILTVDVGAQFLPGATHEASPVLDSGLLGILGMVVAASRGPRPADDPPPTPAAPAPPPPPPAAPPPEPLPTHDPPAGDGRHRAPGDPP